MYFLGLSAPVSDVILLSTSRKLMFFILFLCPVCVLGNGISEVSASGDKALFEILNLQTVTAKRLIDSEFTKNPEKVNMYLEYLNNWNSVLDLILDENQPRYQKYLQSLNERLDLIERKADKKSPSYHILLAEIYAHAGMV